MRLRERMGPGGLRGLQILRSGVQSVRGGFDSHAFPPLLVLLAALATPCAAGGWTVAFERARDATPPPGLGPPAAGTAATGSLALPLQIAGEAAATRRGPKRRGGADSAAAARKPSRFDQPRWVMLRSLVLPGWGQAHNRAWLKAALVAAGNLYLDLRILDDERDLKRLAGQADGVLAEVLGLDAWVASAQAAYDMELATGDPDRIAAAAARLGKARDTRRERIGGLDDRYNHLVITHNELLQRSTSRRWLLGGALAYTLLDAYVDAHFRGFRLEVEGDPALPGGVPSGRSMRVSLRRAF